MQYSANYWCSVVFSIKLPQCNRFRSSRNSHQRKKVSASCRIGFILIHIFKCISSITILNRNSESHEFYHIFDIYALIYRTNKRPKIFSTHQKLKCDDEFYTKATNFFSHIICETKNDQTMYGLRKYYSVHIVRSIKTKDILYSYIT